MKKELSLGIVLVTAGAASYGVLATLVRLAYNQGYTPSEVIFAQYLLGLLSFGVLYLFKQKQLRQPQPLKVKAKTYAKLTLGGSAFGLTGMAYYFSVQYLPVSIAVVLLMQSIWMGTVIECMINRRFPSIFKITGSLIVCVGTVLATNAHQNLEQLPATGIFWGLTTAVMYTISMTVANKVAPTLPAEKRSFYILLGSFLMVASIGLPSLLLKFDTSIFWSWGLLLALFGTVLPPFLFNTGMPKTGVGLGSILIAIEIPVSVSLAYFLLHEQVNLWQWGGILLILLAVVVLNYRILKKSS
ncbi:DMT family transporter [Rapidithrix thailandica]|uniref:DMT family transporter n=1 Tax=Rapidithrix thailandica TaxID=413964 RepID=A0AAW9S7A2_9BACT